MKGIGIKKNMPVRERILLYSVVTDGCWLWSGAKDSKGYGTIGTKNGTQKAHRVSYEEFVGPLEEGLQVDHLCLNTSCVNPRHLELVTGSENMRRRYALQTHCKRGHLLAGGNLRPNRKVRDCRLCENIRVREKARLKKGQPDHGSHRRTDGRL